MPGSELRAFDGAEAPGDPLVFLGDKSAGHAEGCYSRGGAFVYADGRAFGLRSKASNRCAGCARAVAYENMTMLRMDAEENGAPGHVLTLTSREPNTDSGAYRTACSSFWRAFRKRWGYVEYCGFIEWTTGEGPRSGGRRRMHSHWLIKGLDAGDLAAIEEWVSVEWSKLTGAWVVQLAELRTVGGVVGYLALHHEKLSQAPPRGWKGRRLRPSAGYFGASGAVRRERAVAWLRERRMRAEGADDGALLAVALQPAPRVVWGRTEAEKASASILARPGSHFGSLAARRALDAQLLRAAALRACEDEVERLERVYHETRRLWALRTRAQRMLKRPYGATGGGG
jgi:hypothetical protein